MGLRMAEIIDKRMTIVGMRAARASLPTIVNDLKEHPERVYSVMRYQESAAVILNRETFDALIDALASSDDVRDAERTLASEPLASFAAYHTNRLARHQSGTD